MIFFVSGGFLVWASRTPVMATDLGLTTATMSAVVFSLAVGAVVGLPLAGVVIHRLGSTAVIRWSLVANGLALSWVGLASSVWQLAAALGVLGICVSLLDVAQNTAAAQVEAVIGRQIMSTFHGVWSLGGLAGALTGVLAADVPVSVHFPLVAVVLVGVGLPFTWWLLPAAPTPPAERGRAWNRPLLVLGVLVSAILLCEGAANDWTSFYLHNTLGATEATSALAFAVFSLTMAGGRFVGDHLVARWGRRAYLRACGLVAGIGFPPALLVTDPAAGMIGFALLGLGVAGVVPTVFSAAASFHARPAAALATVSTLGYLGLLAGPPLIGALATVSSMRFALSLLVVFPLVLALCANQISNERRSSSTVD
ncbi:MFS transporter [Pseudonocardiaceae bacterium YIM PH 21723]|nr:MFS transporter [Pseudonocardiaceae bacterium YIM PH 21723]